MANSLFPCTTPKVEVIYLDEDEDNDDDDNVPIAQRKRARNQTQIMQTPPPNIRDTSASAEGEQYWSLLDEMVPIGTNRDL